MSMAMSTLGLADEQIVKVVLFGGAILVALFWIVFGTVRDIVRSRAQEQSRREIAAYVAEGSMSPDDAERLLQAGPGRSGCC